MAYLKLLVTGGAGFIGGNFVHYHLKEHPEDRALLEPVASLRIAAPKSVRQSH